MFLGEVIVSAMTFSVFLFILQVGMNKHNIFVFASYSSVMFGEFIRKYLKT